MSSTANTLSRRNPLQKVQQEQSQQPLFFQKCTVISHFSCNFSKCLLDRKGFVWNKLMCLHVKVGKGGFLKPKSVKFEQNCNYFLLWTTKGVVFHCCWGGNCMLQMFHMSTVFWTLIVALFLCNDVMDLTQWNLSIAPINLSIAAKWPR